MLSAEKARENSATIEKTKIAVLRDVEKWAEGKNGNVTKKDIATGMKFAFSYYIPFIENKIKKEGKLTQETRYWYSECIPDFASNAQSISIYNITESEKMSTLEVLSSYFLNNGFQVKKIRQGYKILFCVSWEMPVTNPKNPFFNG